MNETKIREAVGRLPPPPIGMAPLVRERLEAEADLGWDEFDTPVGRLVAAVSRRGLVLVTYGEPQDIVASLARRRSSRIVRSIRRVAPLRRQLDEYFGGRRRRFELDLDWSLVGPFGRRVLRATAAIPYGATRTYGDVARAAGNPRGARAAGGALHANPFVIVVPCHRVVRSNGELGGYGGGVARKRFLLALEARA